MPLAFFYLLPTRAWELLVGSIPAFGLLTRAPGKHLLSIASPIGLFLIAWPIDTPRATYIARTEKLFSAFAIAEAKSVRRMAIIDDLCDADTCYALRDGKPIYSDNTHLAD